MLEIQNVEVYNLHKAFAASGYPMTLGNPEATFQTVASKHERATSLGRSPAGSGHDNFLSGILVTFDVKYPLYWSPEFQRYHFAQIVSSQSTMHRLTVAGSSDEFYSMFNKYVDKDIIDSVKKNIDAYNFLCGYQLSEETCDYYHVDSMVRYETRAELEDEKYYYFMKIRSNLPSGYEMWMHVSTNYLQLKTVFNQRKNHKLREDWGAFCNMCRELPHFMELTQKR